MCSFKRELSHVSQFCRNQQTSSPPPHRTRPFPRRAHSRLYLGVLIWTTNSTRSPAARTATRNSYTSLDSSISSPTMESRLISTSYLYYYGKIRVLGIMGRRPFQKRLPFSRLLNISASNSHSLSPLLTKHIARKCESSPVTAWCSR